MEFPERITGIKKDRIDPKNSHVGRRVGIRWARRGREGGGEGRGRFPEKEEDGEGRRGRGGGWEARNRTELPPFTDIDPSFVPHLPVLLPMSLTDSGEKGENGFPWKVDS